MEFYAKMFENLGELQVREDGEYEPFVQNDSLPTYGVFFDEVYGKPLRPPRKPYFIPDSDCNKAFQSPYSNLVVPMIKQGENVNYAMYDSPGPGIARYATFPTEKYNNDNLIANPFTKYPSLPNVIKGAGQGNSLQYQNLNRPSNIAKESDFVTSLVSKIN